MLQPGEATTPVECERIQQLSEEEKAREVEQLIQAISDEEKKRALCQLLMLYYHRPECYARVPDDTDVPKNRPPGILPYEGK